jgi:Zn-dependent M28 family amino/carboxypeptidase
VIVLLVTGSLWASRANKYKFNGQRALRDVEYQMSLGPRIPQSQAHRLTVEWLVAELRQAGWDVEIQESQMMGHPVRNVVARWGDGRTWVILGAHYDSRLAADMDPVAGNRNLPVPGANDGASGVAVLVEMARVLPYHLEGQALEEQGKVRQVWLVFFDVEDNGNLPGWDWILGSRAFVAELENSPDAVVIVDMIGDADLNIYKERNSDPELTEEIWTQAADLGYADTFIPKYRHSILDDHIPFVEMGIPAVDVIDFSYPYWHTTADLLDKVSEESLQIVGETLLAWLVNR